MKPPLWPAAMALASCVAVAPDDTACAQPPPFIDRSADAGIAFFYFNGMTGAQYLPEIMGSGAAMVDIDNDGDLDLFIAQGDLLHPVAPGARPILPPPPDAAAGHRLFRNELNPSPSSGGDGAATQAEAEAEAATPRFTDISRGSGIDRVDYGMGVAVGDIDNDGRPDLYLTALGRNRLFHNLGGGRFEEIGAAAGVDDPRWSVSAAFTDIDGDGYQDLYVGNYLEVDLAHYRGCRSPSSAPDYCNPGTFPAVSDRLYRNLGDGRFEDISQRSGIGRPTTPTLGVSVADFNLDGRPDLYIANDGEANLLWLNQGNGGFVEDAMMAGAAVNLEGAAEGSMGVDAGDFDGDGDPDLFMTHLNGETHTLYVNDGTGWFEDRSLNLGISSSSKPYTGFGANWLDVNRDGWLDLFIANGEVNRIRALGDRHDPYPLHQPNQLLLNRDGRRFDDVSTQAGPEFARSEVSRGSAVGDIDNDGDPDILVVNNAGPARLLLNQWPGEQHWLGLRLLDDNGGALTGARARITTAAGRVLWRRARSDGSYASANDPRILFGLGDDPAPVDLEITWPGGRAQTWRGLRTGRYLTLTRPDEATE